MSCHFKILFVFNIFEKPQYLPTSSGYEGTKLPFNKKKNSYLVHEESWLFVLEGVERSWSLAKELQSRTQGGEDKGREISLVRNKRGLWHLSWL